MINYTVDLSQYPQAIDQVEKQIDDALDRSVDGLLKLIEETQIKAYTADAYPSRPSGSTYIRSFDLQGSSKTERTGKFSGRWYTDLDYSDKVLGSRHEQVPIHTGRWKSKEQVEAEVEEQAPIIINGELS